MTVRCSFEESGSANDLECILQEMSSLRSTSNSEALSWITSDILIHLLLWDLSVIEGTTENSVSD